MIENCKIKLIFKSKEPAQLFQTIRANKNMPPSFSSTPSHTKTAKNRRLDQKYQLTLGLKGKIVSAAKKEASPKKQFRNAKISQCIIAPCERLEPLQYQYCLTFQSDYKRSFQKGQLMCAGKKAEYCREHPQRQSPGKISRTISRQLSQRSPRLRRPSTSEYLSHKKTGYVQLQKFQRKKPLSMNPNHYEDLYMKKLKVSLNFYYKVQIANRVSADLSLSHKDHPRIRVYVGPGNNQFQVQQILRKRFWYEVVNEPKNCNFYWTIENMNTIHEHQKGCIPNKRWEYFDKTAQLSSAASQHTLKTLQKVKLNGLILSKHDEANVETLIDSNGYQFVYPQMNSSTIITNHIPNNEILHEPKNLLKILQDFYQKQRGCDPWHVYPKTYFICNPSRADIHFYTFTVLQNKKKLWLIKPGERSNDENQVQLLPAAKIMEKLRKVLKDCDQPWTFLLQQYIQRPFLYKGRKFDLCHYILLTSIGGGLRVYWYYQGYIRTSSMPFVLTDLNPLIHFTGDSIQEGGPDYGYYEPGNKITYNDFQRYLQALDPYQPHSFQQQIIPQMKKITLDLIMACYKNIDPKRRPNFELIGLDFMLDYKLSVFLTGVNTNPTLKTNNPVIGKIVPSIIDQCLWLGLDSFVPPKCHFPAGQRLKLGSDPLCSLKFECIFDQFQSP